MQEKIRIRREVFPWFQGGRDADDKNADALDFDARAVDFVVLTHAHIDHSGYLPRLVKDGFKGRVFCTPGFNALKFFAWMDEAKPTWYTAVPTMHQAILSRADRNQDVISANPLRFIRSSSARARWRSEEMTARWAGSLTAIRGAGRWGTRLWC